MSAPSFEFSLTQPVVTGDNHFDKDNRNFYGCDLREAVALKLRPLVNLVGEHRTLVVPAAVIGVGDHHARMSVSALRMLSKACEEAADELEQWERDTKGVLGRGGVWP